MPKKIAIINDISGFGRCSVSVILPIISHLGVQGCTVPTAIFSNHTGFASYFRDDYTSKMPRYIDEWRKLNLQFDGIMSGFLGSARQINIVEDFFKSFRTPQTTILVDPVMGDNGRMYPTYTPQLCKEMRRLIRYADIITPNLTEACFLTNTPYKAEGWRRNELNDMAQKLMDLGTKRLVITGIKIGKTFIGNAIASQDEEIHFSRQHIIEQTRSGTGDVFASILGADAVQGVPFDDSVKRASRFVSQCLEVTLTHDAPRTNGIDFEECLYKLRRR